MMANPPVGEIVDRPLPVEASAEMGHRYFDPKAPTAPEQILGLDTQAVLDLGNTALRVSQLPYDAYRGLRVLPEAVKVVPLIEKMQTGVPLTPEDVRPYRDPIKKLSPAANRIDKMAIATTPLGVGVLLRRALNAKVEREFPVVAAEAIGKAREGIALAEADVEFVATFDNPREQFTVEMETVAEVTHANIMKHHRQRIAAGRPEELPKPEGIRGFFTRAYRAVRNFFGFVARRPKVNPEITAYDAARGIDESFRHLLTDSGDNERRLPMMSGLVLKRLRNINLPPGHEILEGLAFMAPEILNSIFSAVPKRDKYKQLQASVLNNPHEFRFVTHFKNRYGRVYLDSLQYLSRNLLPDLRDVLPTDGQKLQQGFQQLKTMLQFTPAVEPRPGKEEKRHWRDRFKRRKK